MKKSWYKRGLCILLFAAMLTDQMQLCSASVWEAQAVQSKMGQEKKTLRYYDRKKKRWFTMKIDSRVPKHNYDWSNLVYHKNKIRYKDENYITRKGIDVSYHQGKIDWKKVKKAGITFAFLRLGYRSYGAGGNLHLDRQFNRNIREARKAGIDVGVYFFSQAVNEREAREEAAFVIRALHQRKLELPVAYDPEKIGGVPARINHLSRGQITKNTDAFCKKIMTEGYDAILYSNLGDEAFWFQMAQLKKYPVWFADYEKKPRSPYDFLFWQYTSGGKVNGIAGRVDMNLQFMLRDI